MATENGHEGPDPKLDINQPLLGDQLQTLKHPTISQAVQDRLAPFKKYCKCGFELCKLLRHIFSDLQLAAVCRKNADSPVTWLSLALGFGFLCGVGAQLCLLRTPATRLLLPEAVLRR